MSIIKVENLKKSFGSVKAVDGISFSVDEGELFAFLGVNGAGKSTTISILCSTLRRDSGTVVINGRDIDRESDKIKGEIGIVFQNSVLDSALDGLTNLRSRAGLYGIFGTQCEKRIEELCDEFNMKDYIRRPVGKLSGGQRRRLDVARALIHNPKILILDEPTTGLDPKSRENVWTVINGLQKKEGLTVFLTTHYMEEATDADKVVILDSGKIVAQGNPNELKNKYTGDFICLYNSDEEILKQNHIPYITKNGFLEIPCENSLQARDLIIKYPGIFTDFEVIKGKMDDVFLSATGKALEGDEK